MSLQNRISQEFERRFGEKPAFVVRAPGRVNLIGEHTDYNDGFVLPMAIDRAVWIALRPRFDRLVSLHSLDFDQDGQFDLDSLEKSGSGWVEYVKGVAWAMEEARHNLRGWEGVMAGDVPIGAGLSSSAATELATARAFASVSGLEWDPAAMAKLGQKAENQWIGVNSGIMDQLISAAGAADHAILIDCRSLDTQAIPLPPNTAVVVMDTATRRELAESAYNERRAQCEAAAAFFGVKALRDVEPMELTSMLDLLEEVIGKRARHIVTENARTLQAAEAMRGNDPVRLGQLMYESHVSLRDDFEVSSEALNTFVECARKLPGCYGARMTGGGFGGCAVALVRADDAPSFAIGVAVAYQTISGLTPNVYVCQATDGAKVVAD